MLPIVISAAAPALSTIIANSARTAAFEYVTDKLLDRELAKTLDLAIGLGRFVASIAKNDNMAHFLSMVNPLDQKTVPAYEKAIIDNAKIISSIDTDLIDEVTKKVASYIKPLSKAADNLSELFEKSDKSKALSVFNGISLANESLNDQAVSVIGKVLSHSNMSDSFLKTTDSLKDLQSKSFEHLAPTPTQVMSASQSSFLPKFG